MKFETKNGGYRELTNVDNGNRPYRTDHYRGITDTKSVCLRQFGKLLFSVQHY